MENDAFLSNNTSDHLSEFRNSLDAMVKKSAKALSQEESFSQPEELSFVYVLENKLVVM